MQNNTLSKDMEDAIRSAHVSWRLINDPLFRAYCHGRTYDDLALLSAEEIVKAARDKGERSFDKSDAIAFIDEWDSCGFLEWDGRLHWEDFKRFFSHSVDPLWQWNLGSVPERVLNSTRKHLRNHDASMKRCSRTARANGMRNAVVDRLKQECDVLSWRNDAYRGSGASANVSLTASSSEEGVRVTLQGQYYPEPTVAMTLAALDENLEGRLHFSDVLLAFIQRGIRLSATELLQVALPHTLGSSVSYVDLLEEMGQIEGDEMEGYDPIEHLHIQVRAWKQQIVADLAPLNVDELMAAFISCPDESEGARLLFALPLCRS